MDSQFCTMCSIEFLIFVPNELLNLKVEESKSN